MTKRLILFSVLLAAFALQAAAQCVLEPFQLSRVEGYVLSAGSRDNAAEAHLIVPHYPFKLVKWTPTDSSGHFIFKNVKPGHYDLQVFSKGFVSAGVYITVTRPKAKSDDGLILVVLGTDFLSECGGDSITLVSKEKMDQVLRDADGDAR